MLETTLTEGSLECILVAGFREGTLVAALEAMLLAGLREGTLVAVLVVGLMSPIEDVLGLWEIVLEAWEIVLEVGRRSYFEIPFGFRVRPPFFSATNLVKGLRPTRIVSGRVLEGSEELLRDLDRARALSTFEDLVAFSMGVVLEGIWAVLIPDKDRVFGIRRSDRE